MSTFDSNASNMGLQKNCSKFTDQLVTMNKKGWVSGPFLESPYENLRINRLLVVEQTFKDMRDPQDNLIEKLFQVQMP